MDGNKISLRELKMTCQRRVIFVINKNECDLAPVTHPTILNYIIL